MVARTAGAMTNVAATGGAKHCADDKVEKEDTRAGKWQGLQRVLKLLSLLSDSKVD